ncbi:MAG: hypothetical protein ACK41D_00295 [Rubricoccaceae bacterium]
MSDTPRPDRIAGVSTSSETTAAGTGDPQLRSVNLTEDRSPDATRSGRPVNVKLKNVKGMPSDETPGTPPHRPR